MLCPPPPDCAASVAHVSTSLRGRCRAQRGKGRQWEKTRVDASSGVPFCLEHGLALVYTGAIAGTPSSQCVAINCCKPWHVRCSRGRSATSRHTSACDDAGSNDLSAYGGSRKSHTPPNFVVKPRR